SIRLERSHRESPRRRKGSGMSKLVNGLRGAAYAVLALAAGAIVLVEVVGEAARADVPDETYKALNLDKSASPKELYDALVKRYNDPAQGAGTGSFSEFWEPIPITKYLNPRDFYTPPETVDV